MINWNKPIELALDGTPLEIVPLSEGMRSIQPEWTDVKVKHGFWTAAMESRFPSPDAARSYHADGTHVHGHKDLTIRNSDVDRAVPNVEQIARKVLDGQDIQPHEIAYLAHAVLDRT